MVETENRTRARARVVESAPLRSIGAIHNTRFRARARLVETRPNVRVQNHGKHMRSPEEC